MFEEIKKAIDNEMQANLRKQGQYVKDANYQAAADMSRENWGFEKAWVLVDQIERGTLRELENPESRFKP